VTKSIERAQKKVETYHFELRRNLLEYDQVMNEQRKLVYEQRQDVLMGRELTSMIRTMMVHVVADRVAFYGTLDVPAPGQTAAEGEPPLQHPIEELKVWLRTTYNLVADDLGFSRPGTRSTRRSGPPSGPRSWGGSSASSCS
jgi:hypothetical protein